jgi:hypothetical protein
MRDRVYRGAAVVLWVVWVGPVLVGPVGYAAQSVQTMRFSSASWLR